MRCVLLFALLALAAGRALEDDMYTFADFKATYNRQYSSSEEAHRFGCFRKNLDELERLAVLDQSATYGINQFADLCADEFKLSHHNMIPSNRTRKYAPLYSAEQVKSAAATVDWRQKGAVTRVKNQGQCGSCWSFSTTGNVEGQWKLAGNTLVGLSEEELVQCSHNGNQGCKGGLMDTAFEWIVSNGGIDSESDYPYTSGGGTTGTCVNSKLSKVVAKISGHEDVAKDETQMAAYTAQHGPLSIAVDAGLGWQLYHGGIKTSCYAGQLDHGVLIVGYGTDGSTDYWIVKNSWGATWGEQGYIRLKRGVNCNGLKESASSSKI